MKYAVIEQSDEWVVTREGVELARFRAQDDALSDVAQRLRSIGAVEGPVSLSVCYAGRT